MRRNENVLLARPIIFEDPRNAGNEKKEATHELPLFPQAKGRILDDKIIVNCIGRRPRGSLFKMRLKNRETPKSESTNTPSTSHEALETPAPSARLLPSVHTNLTCNQQLLIYQQPNTIEANCSNHPQRRFFKAKIIEAANTPSTSREALETPATSARLLPSVHTDLTCNQQLLIYQQPNTIEANCSNRPQRRFFKAKIIEGNEAPLCIYCAGVRPPRAEVVDAATQVEDEDFITAVDTFTSLGFLVFDTESAASLTITPVSLPPTPTQLRTKSLPPTERIPLTESLPLTIPLPPTAPPTEVMSLPSLVTAPQPRSVPAPVSAPPIVSLPTPVPAPSPMFPLTASSSMSRASPSPVVSTDVFNSESVDEMAPPTAPPTEGMSLPSLVTAPQPRSVPAPVSAPPIVPLPTPVPAPSPMFPLTASSLMSRASPSPVVSTKVFNSESVDEMAPPTAPPTEGMSLPSLVTAPQPRSVPAPVSAPPIVPLPTPVPAPSPMFPLTASSLMSRASPSPVVSTKVFNSESVDEMADSYDSILMRCVENWDWIGSDLIQESLRKALATSERRQAAADQMEVANVPASTQSNEIPPAATTQNNEIVELTDSYDSILMQWAQNWDWIGSDLVQESLRNALAISEQRQKEVANVPANTQNNEIPLAATTQNNEIPPAATMQYNQVSPSSTTQNNIIPPATTTQNYEIPPTATTQNNQSGESSDSYDSILMQCAQDWEESLIQVTDDASVCIISNGTSKRPVATAGNIPRSPSVIMVDDSSSCMEVRPASSRYAAPRYPNVFQRPPQPPVPGAPHFVRRGFVELFASYFGPRLGLAGRDNVPSSSGKRRRLGDRNGNRDLPPIVIEDSDEEAPRSPSADEVVNLD